MDVSNVKFPLENVTATILTWREGPFLDAVLGVVCPKVHRVVILEDDRPMYGKDDPALVPPWETKKVVDDFVARNPQFKDVIDFRVTNFSDDGKQREASRRNESMRIAREEHKTEWAWLVDADEIYTDEQAARLWSLVLDCKAGVVHCSWHTYWRSLRWVVDPPEPFRPAVAMRTDARCREARNFEHPLGKMFINEPLLHHYSYARPPSDILRKLKTWTHAEEVLGGWFQNVFLKWTPEMRDLHPTHPPSYAVAKHISWDIPKVLAGHPYARDEIIQDTVVAKRIKAIILHHANPENCEKLRAALAPAFDVEIWDSGSPSDKIPVGVDRAFGNIYWTGAWNEIMRTFSDYDAVWMLGCDIELRKPARHYLDAIKSAMPFGVWSPAIEGRAHPFMLARNCRGTAVSVRNIEGMCLALSGELMREVKTLVEGSPIGFGQDFWLCWRSRQLGMKNILDGRVVVYHPSEIGYNEHEAHDQMEMAFGKLYGPNFRQTIFEYDETFEGNMNQERKTMTTIFTVDNGWALADFLRVTRNFPNSKRVVLWKGAVTPPKGIQYDIVPFTNFDSFLDGNAIGFFPKVGAMNLAELKMAMAVGIPCVVQVSQAQGLIEHEKTGFVYQDESWALSWLSALEKDPVLRAKVKSNLVAESEPKAVPPEKEAEVKAVLDASGAKPMVEPKAETPATPAPVVAKEAPAPAPVEQKVDSTTPPLVTFITPTFRRATPVLLRCINCCQLQTEKNWEQLVCSDGAEENAARDAVKHLGDPRITYQFTDGRTPGDFGNNVRAEMLKKARGKYVVFFDDDNIILPEYIETMLKALQESNLARFAVCRIVHFGPLNEQATGKAPQILTGEPVKLYHVDSLQVMAEREALIAAGGWNKEKGYLADGHTFEALAASVPHIRVDRVLGFHM